MQCNVKAGTHTAINCWNKRRGGRRALPSRLNTVGKLFEAQKTSRTGADGMNIFSGPAHGFYLIHENTAVPSTSRIIPPMR
jgi:hypothetical protein